jgi:hypothetical protein
MSDLQELFGVNSEQVLRFFIDSLREEVLPAGIVDDELFYVASVLAHYAQTPCYDSGRVAAGSLSEVFDSFVLHGMSGQESTGLNDPEILEIAGSQALLFVGVFRDQMRKRHNVAWYDRLGQSFYNRASDYSPGRRKKEVLLRIAAHFPVWAQTCSGMSRRLRDNYYLLNGD